MSEKRRGLGRGLGALIPSAPSTGTSRPTDVFFKDDGAAKAAALTESLEEHPTGPATSGTRGEDGPSESRQEGSDSTATASAAERSVRFTGNDADTPSRVEARHEPAPDAREPGDAEERRVGPSGGTVGRSVDDHATGAPSEGSRSEVGYAATGVNAAGPTGDGAVRGASAAPERFTGNVHAVEGEAGEPHAAAGDAHAGDGEPGDGDLAPVPGATFAEVPVSSIRPNPRQPRQVFDDDELAELVHSIREIGLLQPIVVRSAPAGEPVPVVETHGDARPEEESSTDRPDDRPHGAVGGGDGVRFELIMGERRWRAAERAGLETIPAIVKDTSDDDMLRDALLENLHRSQLNPLEEAAAYQQLLDDFGCTHEELAGRIGRSRPQISNMLRLLKLPPLVARRVAAGVLSAGHARALLALPDAAAMERMAQRIVAEGLSVRTVEEVVALGGDDARPARASAPRPGNRHPQLDDLAARLSDRFETRVNISLGRRKGKLTVEFASVDDLSRILEVLAPDEDVHA